MAPRDFVGRWAVQQLWHFGLAPIVGGVLSGRSRGLRELGAVLAAVKANFGVSGLGYF
jgi:hypothetical protein